MNVNQIDEYLKQKSHVTSDFKIEWDAYRFMLNGKMFAMRCQNKENTPILTLKMVPQIGAGYRETYPKVITPGYYMNKVHWISIEYDKVDEELMKELMDQSYECAYQGLPKKLLKEWQNN